MYSQIIGTQQIVVTAAFLGVMLVVLMISRRKGGAIRASLKAGKRIAVVEDTAVSPTERIRLISVDDSEFLMLSAKGHAPILISFIQAPAESANSASAKNNTSASMGLAEIDGPKQASRAKPAAQTDGNRLFPSPTERAAFIEKFQSWRRENAAG